MKTSGPLIVNYGIGVDSTAILVEFTRLGIVPDLIVFSDVGGEKPETYEYLEIMDRWLARHGMPRITRVRRYGTGPAGRPIVRKRATTTYDDLEGNMRQNKTLPSLAFGGHSCSMNWKAAAINGYLKQWPPTVTAWALAKCLGDEQQLPCHVIGYDAGPADCRRRQKADKVNAHSCDDHRCARWYPLQDWGWDRERCIEAIVNAGLPVPVKSACFFCPASHQWEVAWLAAEHPELFLRAVAMERRWKAGPHFKGGSTKGLGRRWSWEDWAAEIGILLYDDQIDEDLARSIARDGMPATAGTAQLTPLTVNRVA